MGFAEAGYVLDLRSEQLAAFVGRAPIGANLRCVAFPSRNRKRVGFVAPVVAARYVAARQAAIAGRPPDNVHIRDTPFGARAVVSASRGRDSGRPLPPAQIRTSGFPGLATRYSGSATIDRLP